MVPGRRADGATPDVARLFEQAIGFHQQGRLDDAKACYEDILTQRPNHFDALHMLGVLALQTQQTAAGVALIGRAIALNDGVPATHNNLAMGLRALRRHADAVASYDRAIALKPDFVEAHISRAAVLQELGRHEEALASYDQAILLRADHADVHYARGIALGALNRHEEALAAYDQAVALKGDFAEAFNNRGITLRDLGRYAAAVESYDGAIASRPDFAEAHYNRGNALLNLRRHVAALASYDAAVALKADYPQAYYNRGTVLQQLKRHEAALASFDRAIALRADFAEAQNSRGGVLYALKRHEEAVASFDTVIAARPDDADAHNNRGLALLALRRHAPALASFDTAIALKSDFSDAYLNRGFALQALNRHDEAVASYDKAIALKPDFADAYLNRGAALQELGQLDEARRCFEQAIAIAPGRVPYYSLLVANTRLSAEDPSLLRMLDMASDFAALEDDDKIQLHFALGKALADVGRHDESFQHLITGNALKRRAVSYYEAGEIASLERICDVFTSDMIRSRGGSGADDDTPIFIVGMPRSGSTLIEQILASHPLVFGAGELTGFGDAMHASGVATREARFPDSVPQWSDGTLRDIATRYLRGVRASCPIPEQLPTAQRITDKMLSNFRYLGLIHLILPNARIIHTHRGPIDTCLSCYALAFDELDFTYELGELGRYYRAYARVMTHWHDVLPAGRILDVQYENVVADLPTQAQRIIDHCGLAWDDACLRFHKTRRLVHTRSAVQVRQPIYPDSVRRWRPAPDAMRALIKGLGIDEDRSGLTYADLGDARAVPPQRAAP